jgi:hypothetical protein
MAGLWVLAERALADPLPVVGALSVGNSEIVTK